MSLPPALRGVRAAFVFLTRVPLGGYPYSVDDLRWSAAHFPLVGFVLGGALGLLHFGLLQGLAPWPAAMLTLGVSMMLTGAFHEDGLADTADALGGAYDRDKLFVILKDSRIGTFGGAALIVSIVGRAALLASLGWHAVWALPLVGAVARVGPIWLLTSLPYATPEGARNRDLARCGPAQAAVATVWAVLVLAVAWCAGWVDESRGLALVGALCATTAMAGWRFHGRAGGVTGDFLGATEQVLELVLLAVLAYGVTDGAGGV